MGINESELKLDFNFKNHTKAEIRQIILKDPTRISSFSDLWGKFKGEKIPYDYNHVTTWKKFFLYLFIFLLLYVSVASIFLGLWKF